MSAKLQVLQNLWKLYASMDSLEYASIFEKYECFTIAWRLKRNLNS
jgi:hypothetical protein